MTTYGTIPTSTSPSSSTGTNVEFISRAKERIKLGFGSRRPWKLMFDFHSMNFTRRFVDILTRVKFNLSYFRMNYALVVLLVLFLSLLYNPVSLIVLAVLMAVWLFLYFMRDEPLVVLGRTIDDRVVLIVLSLVTIVALLFTHATGKIVVAVAIGAVLVFVHAALRKTDDLFLDEESAGLMTGVGVGSSSS